MKIQILVTPRYVSITNASYTICTVYLIIKIRNYLNLFKMATRSCAYKDCEYYYVGHENALTKGRTLFAFPKQPQRARIWHENGQVHPKIPHSQLFMCSLHFDRKFISSSKNRTLLVGEAVPFPYEESSSKPEEEPQQVASTSHESYYINLSDDELSINNVDTTSVTTSKYYKSTGPSK